MANRFFKQWHELLVRLFEEAKSLGELKQDTDSDALSRLVMSTVEGAILICKTSKDADGLRRTIGALKSIIMHL